MNRFLIATLLVLPALALAQPASAAPPECVEYAYVADYHWYYVCANPKDLACPVYHKEVHGVTETRTCVGLGLDTAAPQPYCVPTSGGLDYPSWACVDASNPKCAVYTLTTSDAGVTKRCYGVL